jgi:hypothetical protein
MQDFAPFIPEFLGALSSPPAVKGAEPFARINLPATFQFSPATSKSIDIPDTSTHLEYTSTVWDPYHKQVIFLYYFSHIFSNCSS